MRKSFGNRYWYPSIQAIGGVNHPDNRALDVIMDPQPYPISIFDASVCSDGGSTPTGVALAYGDRLASLQSIAQNVGDNMEGMSPALQTGFAQSIYGEYLDNPQLYNDLPNLLSDVGAYVDLNHVASSQLLYQKIRDKKEAMYVQFGAFEDEVEDFEALQSVINNLTQSAQDTSNAANQPGILAQISALKAGLNTLGSNMSGQINQLKSNNYQDILQLYFENEGISVTSTEAAMEKIMQRLTLKTMLGINLTATEEDDIRTIASTCYDTGGRAVFMAQSLAVTLLEERYDLVDCIGARPGIKLNESTNATTFLVAPNPASSSFNLYWKADQYEQVEIEVYSLSGIKQFTGIGLSGNLQINTSDWPSGTYMIKVKNIKDSPVLKVQVIR